MGTVIIVNNTSAKIHVRVTVDNESNGSALFTNIEPGESEGFSRSYEQVAFAWREDTGATDVFMVVPDNHYTVG